MPPLYDFKCDTCEDVVEAWAKVDEKTIACHCGGCMLRKITSNYSIHADFASKDFVTDDITGEPVRITSRRQMRSLMKEHGVTERQAPSKSEIKHRNDLRAHLRNEQLREQKF